MESLKSKKQDLINDDIFKLFINIAIPSSIGTIFQTLYGLVDSIFAGKMISQIALAAIGQVFPINFVIIAIGVGISIGTTSLISNYIGQKKLDKASLIFIQSLIVSVIVSILITLIGLIISEKILFTINSNTETLELSMDYIRIIFISSFIMFFLFSLNSCLSALGDTKSYRNILILSFFINILLNPILINGNFFNINLFDGLGIKGLAYSTVISQLIGVFYLIYKISKTQIFKKIKKVFFMIHKKEILKILSQGSPASIGMMMISIGAYILLIFVGKFGVNAIGGYTAALRFEQLFFLPLLGLNTAVLSMVGQNYGAKNFKRVKEIYNKALIIGCIILLILSIIMFYTSNYAIALFSNEAEIIKYGSKYLKISAFILPIYPFFFISNALFQGLKKSIIVMYVSLLRFVFLPYLVINIVLLYFGLKYELIFISLIFINWILCLLYYFFTVNKLKKIEN